MDRNAFTQKASLKVIGLFIAAILVASMFSVSVGNVAADADLVAPAAQNMTGPAGAGGPAPGAAGDILSSWDNGLAAGWGVGYDSDDNTVWISDATVTNDNIEFLPDGTPTGRSYSTAAWVAQWPADMEYDRTRGYMYQVNPAGDYCIYAWDINTGNVMAVICDPDGVWDTISQRAVAYRETDDTLWVGGWDTGTIYHIKGLSWDNPGEVLDSYSDPYMLIAGLAWHCDGYLYVTGSGTLMVYVLTDDGAYTLVESYPLPGTVLEDYGVGADIDCDGNLWAGTVGNSTYNSTTYLLDTGRPANCCPAPPGPPGVPTANQWGVAAMLTLFTGLLVWAVRRRRLAS